MSTTRTHSHIELQTPIPQDQVPLNLLLKGDKITQLVANGLPMTLITHHYSDSSGASRQLQMSAQRVLGLGLGITSAKLESEIWKDKASFNPSPHDIALPTSALSLECHLKVNHPKELYQEVIELAQTLHWEYAINPKSPNSTILTGYNAPTQAGLLLLLQDSMHLTKKLAQNHETVLSWRRVEAVMEFYQPTQNQ